MEDTYTDTKILVKPKTNFVYYYSIDNDVSAVENRFLISFKNITQDLDSQILSSDIQLYPNPNKGNFNVVLPSNSNEVSVVVYSALGQKLYNDSDLNGQKQLRLNLEGHLSAGIYFVHFKIDSKTIVKKIIVN